MTFYIYILSIIVFIVLFLWDELKCSGQLTVETTLQILIVGLAPVVNTAAILWFIIDSAGDSIVYRKGGKK